MRSYRINLKINNEYISLFTIGYTSDGGFFVKDLINDNKKFAISKIPISRNIMSKFGNHHILIEKCKIYSSVNSPKITHHVDGNCHVSGIGIVSGFYKFFNKPKGVFSNGINLENNINDGGPIFIFGISNIEEIKKTSRAYKRGIDISEKGIIIDPYFSDKSSNNYSFILEFFYFLKKENSNLSNDSEYFSFRHINYGIVPLRLLPCPEQCPGYIGLFVRRVAGNLSSSEKSFNFSFGGGVGTLNKNGEFEEITVSYPFDEEFYKDQKVSGLDFGYIHKIRNFIDDGLFAVKNIFNK